MIQDRYDVVAQAEKIVLQAAKPDWISDDLWEALDSDVIRLYSEVKELEEEMLQAYQVVIRNEEWKQALMLVLKHFTAPDIPFIFTVLDTEADCQEKQREFVSNATVWIREVRELLTSEG